MPRRRRIFFPYVGDTIGGSHRSSLELAAALDVERFEVALGVHQRGPLTAYLDRRNISFMPLPTHDVFDPSAGRIQSLTTSISSTVRLVGFLRRSQIDIVHAHDGRMCLTWGLPSMIARRPFVWHQRTMYQPSRRVDLGMKLAKKIVCNSEFAASSLPPAANRKVRIVYNPVRPAQTKRQAAKMWVRSQLGLAADTEPSIITFVGTLSEQKRPHIFIEAAVLVASQTKNHAVFVMIGSDRDGLGSGLRKLIGASGLADRFYFRGHEDRIEPWIAATDVLVAPGVNDAFGRTLVEAALLRTPFVAADSGGHKELAAMGLNGAYVPPDNPQAFANAIDDALAHGIPESPAYLLRRFSASTHADQIAAIYDSI